MPQFQLEEMEVTSFKIGLNAFYIKTANNAVPPRTAVAPLCHLLTNRCSTLKLDAS